MREKAIRFGKSATLVGVLAEPRKKNDDTAARPAVILLNSGILHHIGACRLHVRIARSLAPRGLRVLRFDHAGIGDSEPRKDTLPFVESAPQEVREAMDYLSEKKGHKEFILVGLCSGADMAFKVAQQDDRVVGLIQMDPYAYRTWKYYLHYYGPRALRVSPWINFAKRQLGKVLPANEPESGSERVPDDFASPEYRRIFPPRDETAQGLSVLTDRSVQMLSIFTGGQERHFNHQSQYVESFPDVNFRDLLRVVFIKESDHIFTNLDHQNMVDDEITEWVASRWGTEQSEEQAAA